MQKLSYGQKYLKFCCNKYSETAYQRVIEEVDGDYNYNADFSV